jgi:hypothetical protein
MYHRPGQLGHRSWLHLVRVTSVSIVAFTLFLTEFAHGWLLLFGPSNDGAIRTLALVALGIYVVGVVRAWTLLGAPRSGISGSRIVGTSCRTKLPRMNTPLLSVTTPLYFQRHRPRLSQPKLTKTPQDKLQPADAGTERCIQPC